MFTCRTVVAVGKARDPSTRAHPKAVLLVPQAEATAETYTSTEGVQRLLEGMGRLPCALLAFAHPCIRFASLEAAKLSLSEGLIASPLAAVIQSVRISSLSVIFRLKVDLLVAILVLS